MSVGGLTAGIITFDAAVGGLPYASELSDDGILVSFYAGTGSCFAAGTCPGTLGSAYGAVPGNGVQEGFTTDDTRAVGPQSNLLTDEDGSAPAGNVVALDYFFAFGSGVPDLRLDLLDFVLDGGALAGASAVLDVFSTSDWSGAPLASTALYVPTGAEPDGNVFSLAIPGGIGTILSARVSFAPSLSGGTADFGTGIDNLEWTTIPEPGTVVLFGSGLLALAAFARKRRAKA
jgi:hypothetical protein